MKKIKSTAFLLAAAISLTGAQAVMAQNITTSDGIVSLELPEQGWIEVPDAETWKSYSNGHDTVAMLHYSNGENLPEIMAADEYHPWIYQRVISNKDEVFLFLGLCEEESHFQEICKIVDSITIQKYNTKTAVTKESLPEKSSFSIEELSKTVYVVAESLNIRSGYTTDDFVLDVLDYGDSVQVTGNVVENGQASGWYRIDYNGNTGYIYSEFVSDSKPSGTSETQSEPQGETQTMDAEPLPRGEGQEVILYRNDGSTFGIYEYSDGYWYDGDGYAYEITGGSGDMWMRLSDGTTFTTYAPSEDTVNISRNDTTISITRGEDGLYYDENGIMFFHREYGAWVDENGAEWF